LHVGENFSTFRSDMTDTPEKAALRRAIQQAGGTGAVSAALAVHKTAPAFWLRSCLPVRRVLEIETLSGVSRHELRPDIYPPPPADAVHHAADQMPHHPDPVAA